MESNTCEYFAGRICPTSVISGEEESISDMIISRVRLRRHWGMERPEGKTLDSYELRKLKSA